MAKPAAKPAAAAAAPTSVPPSPTAITATNAETGNAVALAGQAASTTSNTQIGVAVAGGGNAPVSAVNQNTTTVTDTSAATGRSGVSVALEPTPQAGATPVGGVTSAASGNTSATGVIADNSVSHTAVGVIHVDGANYAGVGLTSSSTTVIENTGASAAQSGAAWAMAAGAPGAPTVTAAQAAGGAPTTQAVSATGLTSQANLTSTMTSDVTLPGGAAGASNGPINITPQQVAAVTAKGSAAVASGAACASGTCAPSATAGQPAGGDARSTSGSADAVGLSATNSVTTNANVSVHVGGQNFAPIQVVIDSVTTILNWGAASSTSGDATAGAGGAPAPAAPAAAAAPAASSGSAQATGAQVQNTVDLQSTASVKVLGDNYTPINVVIDMAADLFNWGRAGAFSGDAQSTGSGSATSGGAVATGLSVLNQVRMWATAAIDIQGNNYAPIKVHIRFNTKINNDGGAMAGTGNVGAGQPSAGTAPTTIQSGGSGGSGGSSGGSSNGGTTSASSSAQGGNTVARANSVVAGVASQQISSANGSMPINSEVVVGMMRNNLPSRDWSPFLESRLPSAVDSAVVPGISSRSGDTLAAGIESSISMANTQIAVCRDPFVQCVAGNASALSVTARDAAFNPAAGDPRNGGPAGTGAGGTGGPGGIRAESGFAGVNATPTPVPSITNQFRQDIGGGAGGGGGGGGGGTARASARNTVRVVTPRPYGYSVIVNLFDQWPGRRLPPMPGQPGHETTSGFVEAGTDWPGVRELPLPKPMLVVEEEVADEVADEPAAVAAPAAPTRATGIARPSARSGSSVGGAIEEDDGELPPLQIVNVEIPWPAVAYLPMPGQAGRIAPIQAEPEPVLAAVPAFVVDPPDAGVTQTEFGPAALLSALLGALGGLRRGRLLIASTVASVVAPVAIRHRRFGPWFARQTARGLAVLRLTLGLFRLW